MLNNEFLIFRKNKVNSPSAMQRFIFDLSEIFWKIVQIYKIDDSSCAMKPAYTQNPVSIFQNECTSHSYETILSSPNHKEGSKEVGFLCFSNTPSDPANFKKCLM